ncbi:hypothetical protein L9F63_001842 [Diploptera punctata]|uniref:Endoplasmic reticulum-based factor for assembly of v-atpase n=1 Tax=Diploptera punctata TaxID=6984 RepID=A0AAD8EIM4_DIPPU|nr:hypothetical protein L9F63_001842 [Diploptera punctata]
MVSYSDALLQFKPSDKLRQFLIDSVATGDSNIPEGIRKYKQSVKDNSEDVYLCIADIKWLQEQFSMNKNKGDDGKNCFHDLMLGCDIKLPEPVIEPRNQQLEARIQRLKAEQADREYKAMTKNVDSVRTHEPEETISYQLKMINRQLIAVAQFIFSVLAGFAFGFIGIELIVGNLDFGFRLLLGVIFALIIALAEIYFLAKKLNEDLPPSHGTSQPTPAGKPHQE